MNRATQAAAEGTFSERNFALLIKLIYSLLFLAFCLTGLLFYQHFTKPPAQYFITTTDGRLIEIRPKS